MRPKKIISGGQSGADQGGLVAAKQLGIETGGWMPKGALTEYGPCLPLLEMYGLKEHRSDKYPPRTRANVRDSDGTAWFGSRTSSGFICTSNAADQYDKPFRVIEDAESLREFVDLHNIRVLNIAGNRESVHKGIHRFTAETIIEAFKEDR